MKYIFCLLLLPLYSEASTSLKLKDITPDTAISDIKPALTPAPPPVPAGIPLKGVPGRPLMNARYNQNNQYNHRDGKTDVQTYQELHNIGRMNNETPSAEGEY